MVHVCISPALPGALASWTILPAALPGDPAIPAWLPAPRSTDTESRAGVTSFLMPVLRSFRVALSTGLVRVNADASFERRPLAVPFGQACQPFGLSFLTMAQACVCPWRNHGAFRLTTHSYLLPGHPVGLGVLPGFIPASRIDGQSLPWGKRISLFTKWWGLGAMPRTSHQASSCQRRN